MAHPIRIIPCLDLDEGRVVKGVKFDHLRDAGDPVELARRYRDEGADEITFLDVSATVEGRGTTLETLHAVAAALTVSITVGGGVRTLEDAARLLEAGASKVSVNTAAIARPKLLTDISNECGSEALVLSIDARRDAEGAFEVTTHGGRRGTGMNVLEWASRAEEAGVGEILLNSIDADGTKDGFDLEMLREVRNAVDCSIIASGGAGQVEHFVAAADAGANAVLAASVFHFGIMTIGEVKAALQRAGHRVT